MQKVPEGRLGEWNIIVHGGHRIFCRPVKCIVVGGANMTTLTVLLRDEPMQRLKELADETGVGPSEQIQASI